MISYKVIYIYHVHGENKNIYYSKALSTFLNYSVFFFLNNNKSSIIIILLTLTFV